MITIAPVLLFGIGTVVLTRERRVSVVTVLIVWFFGFFVAATPLGYALGQVIEHWLSGGGHSGPPAVPTPTGVTRQV